ncbi:Tumor protein p73, partial [Opisthocomus hoazin]
VKMSQSSPADEGTTFEHLWSTLEPDSTYFDLPPPNHTGSNEVSNRTEVTMDVFQMRSMDDSVMSQFNLLNNSMDQSIGSRAAPPSPYSSEHTSNVPTHSPYSQPSSTFDAMSPAPVIPSNTDYPGPHHFEVTFQQSSTAKSATWTVSCTSSCLRESDACCCRRCFRLAGREHPKVSVVFRSGHARVGSPPDGDFTRAASTKTCVICCQRVNIQTVMWVPSAVPYVSCQCVGSSMQARLGKLRGNAGTWGGQDRRHGGWVLGHPLQPPPGQRPGRPGSTGGCSPLGHQRYAGHIQTQLIVNEQQSSSGRNFQLSEKLYRPVIKKWLLKKLERKKISSVVGLSSRICRNRFVRAAQHILTAQGLLPSALAKASPLYILPDLPSKRHLRAVSLVCLVSGSRGGRSPSSPGRLGGSPPPAGRAWELFALAWPLAGPGMLNSHPMQPNGEMNGGHSSQSMVSGSHCTPPPPYNPDPSLVSFLTGLGCPNCIDYFTSQGLQNIYHLQNLSIE